MARLAAYHGSEIAEGRDCGSLRGERRDESFGGHVADQDILREGTAAEAADGRVKAAAAGAPGGGDFGGGLRPDARGDGRRARCPGRSATTAATTSSTSCGCGEANGVGERDGLDAGVGEQVAGGDDFIDAPWVAIGVAEGHGDVGDDVEACFIRERSDGFEGVDGFFRGLVLVALEEAGRDGVGEAEGVDAAAVDGALHALDVDDDADDFECVRIGRRGERGQVGEGERPARSRPSAGRPFQRRRRRRRFGGSRR